MVKSHHGSMLYEQAYFYRGTWLQISRPLTLTGTITPAFVGAGFAYQAGFFNVGLFIVYVMTAIIIQATINMLNDFYDFLNGQDEAKWTKSVADQRNGYIPIKVIPIVALLFLFVASVAGAWLALESNLLIIPVGIISILAGIKYSAGEKSLASLALGEVVAFIFLGVVATTLPFIIQTNYLSGEIFAVSCLFGLLISSMILTNNMRDIDKDKPFRKTLAIILGYENAKRLLIFLLGTLYFLVPLLVMAGVLSSTAFLVFFAFPLAMKLIKSFRKGASNLEKRLAMKYAAYHHFAFGILMSLAVWF